MFALILRYLPLMRVLGILIAFFSYVGYVYHKGAVSEQSKQQKQAVKEVKLHDKIEQKNTVSPDADLNKRLQRWYRD